MTTPRFAILGTAGHIDHGKTALVKLLTGVDTDRLKEEKERGISIDLGFAHIRLPDGTECGLVDVPGHERFVKNMLAGAGGIDAVLLVIAADEGVMPQTREHVDIVRLLGVTRAVVALTKSDLVEPDWVDFVREEVREYLAGGPFAEAPIVPVSSKTGAGREELLAALGDALAGLEERSVDRPARLPIDRAFVVEGFGTVVTGTLWRGRLRPGDRVVVEPAGLATRVRSVQVHGADVTEARAGQRTAVALHGVEKAAIARGHWVLAPDTLVPSWMIDARLNLVADAPLNLVADAPRPLANRTRVRFHLGASELLGRVVLLDREELEPGASAVVQIRLESPVVADRGDRFVIRSYSPQRAIGGGVVLLPTPEKHRRHDAEVVARLGIEEQGGPEERVRHALDGAPFGATAEALARDTGLSSADVATVLDALAEHEGLVRLGDGRAMTAAALRALGDRLLEAARSWQSASVFRWGIPRGDLKSRLPKEIDAPLFDHVIEDLLGAGRLHRKGDRYRADSADAERGVREEKLLESVRAAFARTPFAPPNLKELEAELKLGPVLGEILGVLAAEGELVKIDADFYYPRETLLSMRERLRAYFSDRETMTVADLRELFAISRKHAVPVLEQFDRAGWTRRMGDVRTAGRFLSNDEPTA
jgi:selenocysteine-specific elongation factor